MHIERQNLFIGIFIIALGLFFLADNLNWIPESVSLGDLWPVFLIIFGVWMMTEKQGR